DVHMQGQWTRPEFTGLDSATITVEHVHLAMLVSKDHFPLQIDFHCSRRTFVIPDVLIDGGNVKVLHRCIRRTDRRCRLLNLLAARQRLQISLEFIEDPEESPTAFRKVGGAAAIVEIVAGLLLRSPRCWNGRIVAFPDRQVNGAPGHRCDSVPLHREPMPCYMPRMYFVCRPYQGTHQNRIAQIGPQQRGAWIAVYAGYKEFRCIRILG